MRVEKEPVDLSFRGLFGSMTRTKCIFKGGSGTHGGETIIGVAVDEATRLEN